MPKTPSQGSDRHETHSLIQENLPLIKSIARQFRKKLPPSVSLGDMQGAGALGLLDAVSKRSKKETFSSYVRIRIRGAMFDELRTNDWLPRHAYKKTKDNDNGPPPPSLVAYFDDLSMESEKTPADLSLENDAFKVLLKKRAANTLQASLDHLLERDRLVIHLHYFRGMKFKEIARFLGIREARLSQIHNRALSSLRSKNQNIFKCSQ